MYGDAEVWVAGLVESWQLKGWVAGEWAEGESRNNTQGRKGGDPLKTATRGVLGCGDGKKRVSKFG